jgi:hypothetical protein
VVRLPAFFFSVFCGIRPFRLAARPFTIATRSPQSCQSLAAVKLLRRSSPWGMPLSGFTAIVGSAYLCSVDSLATGFFGS